MNETRDVHVGIFFVVRMYKADCSLQDFRMLPQVILVFIIRSGNLKYAGFSARFIFGVDAQLGIQSVMNYARCLFSAGRLLVTRLTNDSLSQHD